MDVSWALERHIRSARRLARWSHLGLLAVSAGLPLALYLRTMPPTVYGLDSAELSVGAYTLGLVHAPGYPLYLMLGKLFTLLPVGDVGYRMNLMSAAFGVVTLALLLVIIQRLTRQRGAALAATLLLAFSWYFWTDAIVAEVYTLQVGFLAGLLLLLLEWRRRREPRWLYAFGLVAGLSLANYPATGLLLPGLLAFIGHTDRHALRRPRHLAGMGLAFAAGLAVYLYLPLRYLARPAFNYIGHYDAMGVFHPTDLTKPEHLWWVFSGGPFQGLMFDYTPVEAMREALRYTYQLWGNFMGVGLPLGLIGVWRNWQRDRGSALALTLMFVGYTLFYVNYRVVDKHTMFLPSYLIWSIWIGWGYAALLAWVGRPWRSGLLMLCFIPALAALLINFPLADVSWDRRAHDNAAALLEATAPHALVFGQWGSAAPLAYLQLVEGRRPDVTVINRFFITTEDARTLIEREIRRRPVYLADPALDSPLIDSYRLELAGPGVRLLPEKAR